jgi:hypothetical protein
MSLGIYRGVPYTIRTSGAAAYRHRRDVERPRGYPKGMYERAIQGDRVKQLRDPQSLDSVPDDAARKPTPSTELPRSEY